MTIYSFQSTSDSHSVTANIQQIFHLINNRNDKLPSKSNVCRSEVNRTNPSLRHDRSTARHYDEDLDGIIDALKEEFGIMHFEHQEMTRQVDESDDAVLKRDLEMEMEAIVERMTVKSEQIEKLRAIKVREALIWSYYRTIFFG